LAFHDIGKEAAPVFRRNLGALKRIANVVSLNALFDSALVRGRLNVALTFDDGYRSWIDTVAPALLELGLPATFFISSGLVGNHESTTQEVLKRKLFKKLAPRDITGFLRTEDVIWLSRNGFGIGGHTVNHCVLSDEPSEERVTWEVRTDKQRLEEMISAPVDFFAYPCGDYRNRNVDLPRIIASCGFRGAVTSFPGPNYSHDEAYTLRRETITSAMNTAVFEARASGSYDAIQWLKDSIPRKRNPQFVGGSNAVHT